MRRRDPYLRLRGLAHRFGYHLVRADHYSPIPEADKLDPATWDTPAPMPEVDLRLDESLDYLARLARYVQEYAPPDHPPGTANGYYRANNMYGPLDAEILYAIVRDQRPRRIVDIGAGFSTLVIEDALAANAAEGAHCDHQVFDPYPAGILAGRVDVTPVTAQEVPPEAFAALEQGDVLFIDTTHTVKPRSDVLRLLLEVIPTITEGVFVHVHDFFRPFEYPRFLMDLGYYWQEQYVLQALLACNDQFEVVMANHALSRLRTGQVEALVPRLPRPAGSALWLRRTAV